MTSIPEDLDELLGEADAVPPRHLPRSRLHPARRPGALWDEALRRVFGNTATDTTPD
jgi:hypothetical protein